MYFRNEMRSTTKMYRAKIEAAEKLAAEWRNGTGDKVWFTNSPKQKEEIEKAELERRAAVIDGVNALEAVVEKFKAEIEDRYTPHGEDLTDDAKIFSSGIDLTQDELTEYVRRYESNLTMLRLIGDYAEKHCPEFAKTGALKVFIPKGKKIAAADLLLKYCSGALTDELSYQNVIEDEANFKRVCGTELADE